MPTKTSSDKTRRSVADILVSRYEIPPEEIEKASKAAKSSGLRLELALRQRNVISESQMTHAVSEYLDMPPLTLAHFSPDEDLVKSMPARVIDGLQAFPIARWGDVLAVVMADPFDQESFEEIRELTGSEILSFVAPQRQVDALMKRYRQKPMQRLQDVLRDVPTLPADLEMGAVEDTTNFDDMFDLAGEAVVVRLVNTILIEAVEGRASDIHIEPGEREVHIRYRIDGVLYDQPALPRHMQWAVVSRVKILANLDIAERRLPQDGRFSISTEDRNADVRVSIVPTVHGQKVVLRILDKTNLSPDLASLGLEAATLEQLQYAIHQPHGMVLVTGPTGSGKTTTLYSAMQELNQPSVNIVTVEDPVEYQLPRITQIQIKPDIGLTFASGLRSILRQDPDIVMVGEIRDRETAGIAVEAAMTGHLVMSTLHTNDSPGAVVRLLHMGIEPFLIASSLLLAQAQRIYRKLCPICKRRRDVPMEILQTHDIDPSMFGDVTFYRPEGCAQCGNIGYRGREAIMEILPVDEEMRELILRQCSALEVRRRAVANGMLTLREVGLLRVKRGGTSIEEILRVTAHT
ncbi:MAG: Flp pilus assembly complex ATPase component TadA [Kiritimatiellae bacterium]|nr:Flp pilus assembly complex ATPase component TadA [Kiritimatiellia bacterium]